ncbi:TetR/AcrR family transcriptional regulator [Xenorhabdus khoisanae]|uniref:TetR/AcrR family transcriptional regulator n=1 Tax=Xenorhabdus khoisanae TaxID=880157 RepID=UPI00235864EB|nr:TetR/AcrR family transcriptional regulator [Xenorhabdus khoisanae]MDC9615014.1 TetR/AcrR family transcriptional regulator [Xenorhabdus khoisanae]
MRNKEFDPDEITDKAMNVFWLRGYEGTSIQDLVEGTGLSRSSLYSTFQSKHHLYQQALKHYSSVTSENIALISGNGDVKILLRTLLEKIADDEINDECQRGCFVANASLELAGHDPEIASLVSENFRRLQSAFEGLIKRGQKTSEISLEKDPTALSYFLLNNIQGMRVVSKGFPIQKRKSVLYNIIDIVLSRL